MPDTQTKTSKRIQITPFTIVNALLLILFAGICIYPFYYLIINSISSNTLSANGQVNILPKEMHLSNYAKVFNIPGLTRAAFVSIMRTIIGTISTVLVCAYLGFMFTQEKMWGRKLWYRFVIVTMYFNAGLIPWFLTLKSLGLTNNFLAYILPALVQPFNIILVKTYIESVPKALQEAAIIDGAGVMTVFVRVMLPVIKPILATVAIFCALGQWNSFIDTLVLMTDQKLYTLQYILFHYINSANALANLITGSTGGTAALAKAAEAQTATSVRMTVSVIVVMPILFVYPFFQRYFVKGIMIGSIKG